MLARRFCAGRMSAFSGGGGGSSRMCGSTRPIAHAALVRSPHAPAAVRRVDTAQAGACCQLLRRGARAMKPPRFRYLRAESVDGALQALADNADARILAGGQSLIPLMNLRMVKPACLDRHQPHSGPRRHQGGRRRHRHRRARPAQRREALAAGPGALPAADGGLRVHRAPHGAEPRAPSAAISATPIPRRRRRR